MELLPAVTRAPPLTLRRSTLPKVVSTVADSATVSPVICALVACTVTLLPMREKRMLLKVVSSIAMPATPVTSTPPFWLRTVTSPFASNTRTPPNVLVMEAAPPILVASILPLLLRTVNPRPALVTRMPPNRLVTSTVPVTSAGHDRAIAVQYRHIAIVAAHFHVAEAVLDAMTAAASCKDHGAIAVVDVGRTAQAWLHRRGRSGCAGRGAWFRAE